MPSQLSKGTTFVDGQSYAATDFNNVVDAGVILAGAITEQTDVAPASVDSFLFYDSSGSTLAKCTQAELVASIPSGGANGTFCLRKLGSTAGMAAAGDDSRFPALITGIRQGNGSSADTVATTNDIAFDTSSTATSGTATLNWALSNVYYANLAGNLTLSHANAATGRQVTLVVKLNGFSFTFTSPATLGSLVTLGSGTTIWQYTFTHTPGGITAVVIKQ